MSDASNSCCDFAGSYDLSCLPEIKKLEQAALGCDYGGTSWTTREQVAAIQQSLQLDKTHQLLDVGSGAGWPGLLLGQLANCRVTLLDIPLNALSQAAQRAAADGMSDQVDIVSGSGTALPFNDQSFDRISHSDVLCCLPDKQQFLTEARRVSRDNSSMHFSVILPAADLPRAIFDDVVNTGPPFIAVEGSYPELLATAGWHVSDREDVTREYQRSLQRLVEGIRENEDDLVALLGEDELVAKREHREDQIVLIDAGYMRRETYLVTATR